MYCPYCKSDQTYVIDSRDAEASQSVRRRRVCEACSRRFTTYERIEGLDLQVIKKDGSTETFSREKIKKGLIKATFTRPVSVAQINQLIDEVEEKLRLRDSREIKSWEIGNLVINRLRKFDKVSYLLFACIYRDFDSLEDFEVELAKIKS